MYWGLSQQTIKVYCTGAFSCHFNATEALSPQRIVVVLKKSHHVINFKKYSKSFKVSSVSILLLIGQCHSIFTNAIIIFRLSGPSPVFILKIYPSKWC